MMSQTDSDQFVGAYLDPRQLVEKCERGLTGLARFRSLAPAAAAVGADFPTPAEIDRACEPIVEIDLLAVLSDLALVIDAHLRLSGFAQASAGRGLDGVWTGRAASEAVIAMSEHAALGDRNLAPLRVLAARAAAAWRGLHSVLEPVVESLDAASHPLLAGVPIGAVAPALAAGELSAPAFAREIAARVTTFRAATAAARATIGPILTELGGGVAAPAVDAPGAPTAVASGVGTSAGGSGDLVLAGEQ